VRRASTFAQQAAASCGKLAAALRNGAAMKRRMRARSSPSGAGPLAVGASWRRSVLVLAAGVLILALVVAPDRPEPARWRHCSWRSERQSCGRSWRPVRCRSLESTHDRLHRPAEYCSCWSGQVGRPSDAALFCGVATGGTTNGITTPPRTRRRRSHLSQLATVHGVPMRTACCNRHIPYGMRILQRPREGRGTRAAGPACWNGTTAVRG
jgi:hypothetical protein